MNEPSDREPLPHDPLADELRSYRPAAVSPELRVAIGANMKEGRTRTTIWRATLAVATAACLLVAALLWRSLAPPASGGAAPDGRSIAVQPAPSADPLALPDRPSAPSDGPGGPVVADSEPPPASLWAYRRAAARSIDELDALLAIDAARLLPTVEPAGPFTVRHQNGS